MKKLILSISIGLISLTTHSQTQCYKDSLAWTLQGGISNYLPFCGNDYNNSTTKSNIRRWGNQPTDSLYQLCQSSWFNTTADRPTLTTDRFTTPNKAMSFDGDDFLVYKTNGFNNGGGNGNHSFSFSVWVKPNSSSVGSVRAIVGGNKIKNHYSTIANYGTIPFLYLLNDKVYASVTTYDANPSPTNVSWQPNSVEIGAINTNWTNYSATFNANTRKAFFYVNGVVVDSIVQPSNGAFIMANPNTYGGFDFDLNVGNCVDVIYNCGVYTNVSYNNGFEGKLDDILFYNRVLSHNEVNSIYQTSGNYDLEKVDTMYIHDTITIVNCQYYDTTYTNINVYDTIQVPYYYDVPVMVYDTTYVTIYDTIRTTIVDTLLINWRVINQVGLQNVEGFKDIKVYPIPTQKVLTIDIGDMIQSYYYSTIVQLDYYIYNEYGALVMNGQLTQGKTNIDVGNLSNGNYKLVLDDHVWNLPTTKNIIIIN